MNGWVGFDLDGTLAVYDGYVDPGHIGVPIEKNVARVRELLARRVEVRVFTARAYSDGSPTQNIYVELAIQAVKAWCVDVFGVALEVTCCKDFNMIELWDDRAVQVEFNTGRVVLGTVSRVIDLPGADDGWSNHE